MDSVQTRVAEAELIARALSDADYRVAAAVPDGGLDPLLRTLPTSAVHFVACTREDEAVAIAGGAYLGGHKGVVLMQSSGLGNCANAFASLIEYYDMPLLLLVSLRGAAGERVGAQLPFGRRVFTFLELFGFNVSRPHTFDDLRDAITTSHGRTAIVASPRDWLLMLGALQ